MQSLSGKLYFELFKKSVKFYVIIVKHITNEDVFDFVMIQLLRVK